MTSFTYAIADLHGRFDLLQQSVGIIRKHAEARAFRVVFLGDYVDRGPESHQILEWLFTDRPASWPALAGNHEDMMRRCCLGEAPLNWWIGNGGGQTLMSYGYRQGDLLRPFPEPLGDHLYLLGKLPLFVEDEHRIYVHAGVPPLTPVSEAKANELQWMLHDRGQGYRDASVFPDLPHVSGKHVVHGHEQSATHPLLLPHRTDLDSFAWLTGRLAIGVFADDQPGGPVEVLWAEGEPA